MIDIYELGDWKNQLGISFIENEQIMKYHKTLIWGTSNSIHKLNKKTI